MLRSFAGILAAAIAAGLMPPNAKAWDHPGHMATAAIAFAEIKREQNSNWGR